MADELSDTDIGLSDDAIGLGAPTSDQQPQPQAAQGLSDADIGLSDDAIGLTPRPTAETPLKTFGREAAHAAVPAAGGLVAGAAGGALAGAFLGPVGAVGGAIIGGLGGAYVTDKVQEAALEEIGWDDSIQRAANIEANPKSAFAGQMTPAMLAMRPDRAAPIAARALSGGMMAGIEGGQELYNDGTISPGKVAAAAAAGALLPTPNRVGAKVIGAGERAGAAAASYVPGRPNKQANPAAVPEQNEVAAANDQPIVTGETSLQQSPPTVDGATVGNPQSSPGRSERQYGKGKGPSRDVPDMLTEGDFTPDVAEALQASLDANAVVDRGPLPEIPGKQPSAASPDSFNYTGTKPVETGLEQAAAEQGIPGAANPDEGLLAASEAQRQAGARKGVEPEPEPSSYTLDTERPAAPAREVLTDADIGVTPHPVDKIAEAAKETHTSPSEAQINADNYKKGGGRLFGREIKIENAKGSIRRSKPGFEPKWEVEMPYDYGDIKGTKGADGDNIDIGVIGTGDKHFVVDQRNTETGKFDEHKVLAYAKDAQDAMDHYVRGFSDERGLDRLGSIKEVSEQDLKAWLGQPGAKRKPFDPEFKEAAGPSEGEKPLPKVVTAAVTKMQERGIPQEAIDRFLAMEPAARLGEASKFVNESETVSVRPNRIRTPAPEVEGILNDEGKPVTARSKADAANKSRDVATMNRAYEAVKERFPEEMPTTPEAKKELYENLQSYIAATKDVKYRPNFKHEPYLLARAAKKLLLAKNPSEKSWTEFSEVMHQLRAGNAQDVRQGQRIEADIGRSRRSGDEAIADAEARSASTNNVEDAMIEALDRAKAGEFKGDIPHEEGPEIRTPVETKADVEKLESAQKALDITKPEGRAKLQAETAKLAENLLKDVQRKPPVQESEGAASAVRKIDVGGIDKQKYIDMLNKASAKNKADAGAIREEELGKFDAKPPKPKDLVEGLRALGSDFVNDKSGSLNHQKIMQHYNAVVSPIMRAFTKKVGSLTDLATSTGGYRATDKMTRTDAVLAHVISDRDSRIASKAYVLDAMYDQWIKNSTPKEQVAFLKTLEKVDAHDTPRFRGALVGAGISAEKSKWMAEQAVDYRNIMDRIFREDAAHGSDAVYRENYVSHIFEDDKAVNDFIEQKIKTLGATWYQKARMFDLIDEAIAAGFKLKYDNPIDIVNARWAASIRSNSIVDAARALQKEGLAFPVKEAYDGVKKAWDFKRQLPDGNQWIFAPDAVPLWKNAMEAVGLTENKGPLGSLFRGWMQVKRIVVPMQLMLSAFHELHVVANILPAQALDHAFQQSVKDRQWVKNYATAFKDIKDGLLFAAPLDHLPYVGNWLDKSGKYSNYAGTRVQEIWRLPDSELTPGERMVKQMFREAGTSPYQSHEDIIGAKRDFSQALADFGRDKSFGAGARIAVNAIRRGMEKFQEPMFKYQIPRLKNAMLLRGMTDALKAKPELATNPTQRRIVFQELARNIDDRFGEMFYSRLFWNKTVKDAGIGAMVSMSWNLGQVRQVAGAANQSRQAMIRLITGDQRTPIEKARQTAESKISFVGHYVGLSMISAGLISYALTGEMPQGMDYVFPRNGVKNRDGSDQRLTTPFNTREAVMLKAHADEHNSWVGGAAQLLWNKTVLQPVVEAWGNRDFFGNRLWDTNAPGWKSTLQGIDATLGRLFNPISISGAQRAKETGGGKTGQALAYAGFGPAPKYVNETPMERRINHLLGEEAVATHKPYQYGEKTGLGRGLVQDTVRGFAGDKLQSELRKEGRIENDPAKLMQSGLSARTTARMIANPNNEFQVKFSRLPFETQRALASEMDQEEFQRLVVRNMEQAGGFQKNKFKLIQERSLNR